MHLRSCSPLLIVKLDFTEHEGNVHGSKSDPNNPDAGTLGH